MCGIAGIIAKNGKAKREHLQAMLDLIKHRGPNGSGVFLEDEIALGHNRLAVTDLSAQGQQPFFYQDRYVLVFNGEIVNYLEVRQELEKVGYKFHTQTDTEIIPAAYDHWGKDCLQRFNGMWSFALYDKQTKNIFAARDRLGVKPFYYYDRPDYLAFASEIKQFTCLPGWQAELNQRIALEFLVFSGLDHSEQTFFQGVKQLLGGHYLTYEQGQLQVERWYSQPIAKQKFSPEEYYKRLLDSVKLCLPAEVKIGSCLSGGIDSSSIVMLMHKLLPDEPLETISACSRYAQYDEQKFIDLVLQKTGAAAHKIYPEYENLMADLDKIVWHQDEPFDSTSVFAQWNVFAEAKRNGLTVMLDGQGADEQLAGYHEYYGRFFTGLLRRGKFVLLLKELKAYKKLHGYTNYNIIRQLANNLLPHFLKRFFKKLRNKERLDWLNISAKQKSVYEKNYSSVQAAVLAQLEYTNLPRLLHYEDRDSMAHSIAARVPFLDYRLVEYTTGLPDEAKIKNGYTKYVLREAMNGILPEQIRLRVDKKGFVTPEEVWFKDNLSAMRAELQKAVEQAGSLFNNKILAMYDNFAAGKTAYDPVFWRIICFGRWQKLFNVKV